MNRTKELPERISGAVESLISDLKAIFGEELKKVILYGSYSRGDYTEESDVDIIVLISSPAVKKFNELLADLSAKHLIKSDVLFSIIVSNVQFYNKWKSTMDLFINIESEGIAVV